MRFAFTGGGTGGHIFPALAVAAVLQSQGHEVHYVGDQGGMEARIVPEAGVAFTGIVSGKLDRTAFRPREAGKVLRGIRSAEQVLTQIKPQAVFSTGGYAGFPLALVAQNRGLPVVLLEQNAKLGLANRILAPRARLVAWAYPPPGNSARYRQVGLPIREAKVAQSEARAALGLEADLPTLLILGGSQGAQVFNQNLPNLLTEWLQQGQVLHQTGTRWLEQTQNSFPPHPSYHLRGFLDTVLAWSAADLAITRAGAMTLAEAAYHRVPLIMVPLPSSASGHQEANAKLYHAQGAGVFLPQAQLAEIGTVLAGLDSSARLAMVEQLAHFDPAGAANKLAQIMLEIV